MTGSFLTLAALATTLVPGLQVSEAADWGYQDTGDYDCALLRTHEHATLLIRRAATAAAAQELRAREHATAALTTGMRARLPFAVPETLGARLHGERPFAMYRFIAGTTADRVPLEFDSALVASLGQAIAAIHALPKQAVTSAGLTQISPMQMRESTSKLIDRADATGKLPQALVSRWGSAIEDAALWDFTPSVIHGSLERGSFVVAGTSVAGVLGWSDFRVGDPAVDMRWVQALDGAVLRSLLDEYVEARGASVDRQLQTRALLYAELELARWLLYGVEQGNEAVIADAEQLLDGLVTRVRGLAESELRHATLPVLDLAEVQRLLADAGDRTRTRRIRHGAEPFASANEVLDDEIDEDSK